MRTTDWIEFIVLLGFAAVTATAFGTWQESVHAGVFMCGTLLWIGRV